jgi:hydroxylysine kinase
MLMSQSMTMTKPLPTPTLDAPLCRPCLVDPAQVAAWAEAHYGLAGVATPIAGEVDLNFRLETDQGRFVAKLSHAAEKAETLAFQTAAMERIATVAPDLPAPRPVAASSGEHIGTVVLANGERRLFRLITWLDGVPLHGVNRSARTRAATGRLAADFALALSGFSHEGARRPLIWDMTQALALEPRLDALPQAARVLAEPVFRRFARDFLPQIGRFRAGIVHNDLNLHNLLVDPADHGRISGCIDFGDMVHAPYIVDLGVAAAYQADPEGDLVGSIVEMAAAYHQRWPIPPEERGWLLDCTAMRAAMTVIITHWSAHNNPANAPYLLRNEPLARRLLAAFARLDRISALRRIEEALA